MQQPPGGPVSSHSQLHSNQWGPVKTPSLFSPSPSSLSTAIMTDELLCMSFVCLCVCYCIDLLQRTRSDSAWGQFWRGKEWGLGGAAGSSSPVVWHCVWGQRAPRAPLPRRIPPTELIPCSSGLTNFTVLAPTALSRHWFTLQTCLSHRYPSPALTLTLTLITLLRCQC